MPEANKDNITAVCSLQKNGAFASGHRMGQILLWDMISLTEDSVSYVCSKILKGHIAIISALCQLHDGTLTSGSKDTLIKVWDVDTGSCTRSIKVHAFQVDFLVAHPELSSVLSW